MTVDGFQFVNQIIVTSSVIEKVQSRFLYQFHKGQEWNNMNIIPDLCVKNSLSFCFVCE